MPMTAKDTFVQGQLFLESMSHQVKATEVPLNEKSQCKTDDKAFRAKEARGSFT